MTSSETIALSSTFIAIFALGVAIWQGYVTRRHSILSVKPSLELFATLSDEAASGIELRNGGLGPAIIDRLEISTSTKSINVASRADWQRVILELWGELPECVVSHLALDTHTIVSAGGTRTLLSLASKTGPKETRAYLLAALSRSRLTLSYRCMYGKHFQVALDGERIAA